MLTLDDGSWRAKNAPELSLKYLMDSIRKIKQYLHYTNWWYKSKYSSSPKDIIKSAKKIYEKLYIKAKAATAEFLSKIPNRKKISNEDFNPKTAERVKPWFFVTFNIIWRHLSWKFHWISSSRSEDINNFSVNINYFHPFSPIFWIF